MTGLRNLIPPPVTLTLIGLALAIGYGIPDSETANLYSATPESPQQEATEDDLQNALLELTEPGNYKSVISKATDRPLFSETRRNPEIPLAETNMPEETRDPTATASDVQEASPEPAPPVAPQLTYLGFLGTEATEMALLKTPNSGDEFWVRHGDIVEGWTVTKITNMHIRLTQGIFEYFVDINL